MSARATEIEIDRERFRSLSELGGRGVFLRQRNGFELDHLLEVAAVTEAAIGFVGNTSWHLDHLSEGHPAVNGPMLFTFTRRRASGAI